MRKLSLFIFFVSSHACVAQDNPAFTNNPHFTANPTFNNTPVHTTTISPQFITNTTSTINAVGVQMKDVAFTIIQKAQEICTKENYNSAKDALKTLLWQYRSNIVMGTLLTAYSSTNMILLHDYYYLKNAERWSCWKQDSTFELLCAIPHTELTQELIRSIGEYHYNKKNPNDASHPLITFIAAIEHEIKICKRYLKVANAIKTMHLTKIFPINDRKIAEVQGFLDRCSFVKHLFLSWLTERNLINKSRKTSLFKAFRITSRSVN